MRSALLFSALRLAIFAVVWFLLTLLMPDAAWFWTGILAAVIAMLISIPLLGQQRQALAETLEQKNEKRQERRARARSASEADADEEDALLDAKDEDASSDEADDDSAPDAADEDASESEREGQRESR